jgi:leucyl-tRNA synthetase
VKKSTGPLRRLKFVCFTITKPGLIVNAKFPKPFAPVDEALLVSIEYVRKMVKFVRDLEIASQKKKQKGKGGRINFEPTKPKALKLFVATKFPAWQDMAVEVVKAHNDEVI